MKKIVTFMLVLTLVIGVANAVDPYTYDGSQDAGGSGGVGAFDALDGTWGHDNGSDQWDGTGIGVGNPGGAVSITEGLDTFLRIQETGDPRDYGLGDPGSNRKIMLLHDLAGASDTFLDDGISLTFRARIPTSGVLDMLHPKGGGGVVAYPAGGDGYVVHDGGKGAISLRQISGDSIISFSLVLEGDPDGWNNEFTADGLTMNHLNGNVSTGDVDSGDAGTINFLALDPTVWHDYAIDIVAGGAGTHIVSVSVDGGLANIFDVTAGSGNDASLNYLALGQGATTPGGAMDIDFVSIPEPMTLSLLGLGALGLIRRRK